MQRAWFILVGLSLVGCQAAAPAPVEREQAAEEFAEPEAVVASALVFDPPVALDEAPLELSRAAREPGVSIGYEELTAEYFSVRLDDRQVGGGFGFGRGFGRFGGGGSFDRYERRAVSERVGVRYR